MLLFSLFYFYTKWMEVLFNYKNRILEYSIYLYVYKSIILSKKKMYSTYIFEVTYSCTNVT